MIFAFLQANWRIIALVLLLGSTYVGGRLDGGSRVQVRWDRQRLEDQQAAIAQIQKIQKQAAQDSAVYEAEAAKLRNTNQQVQGRLKNVLAQNSALRSCTVDDHMLLIYGDLTKETIH